MESQFCYRNFHFFKFKDKFTHLPFIERDRIRRRNFSWVNYHFQTQAKRKIYYIIYRDLGFFYYFSVFSVFCVARNFKFYICRRIFLNCSRNIRKQMVPASGGIGAFHLAMKLGISAPISFYGKRC